MGLASPFFNCGTNSTNCCSAVCGVFVASVDAVGFGPPSPEGGVFLVSTIGVGGGSVALTLPSPGGGGFVASTATACVLVASGDLKTL